jgi:hypothetical protein
MAEGLETPKAKCLYCKKDFAKGGMTCHLLSCKARQEALATEEKSDKIYHLRIEGTYANQYWMNVEIAGSKQLEHLDRFLRDIWLECCGHLSAFDINGTRYASYPMGEYGERNLKKKISDVLTADTTFDHTYDYGTSTDLKLKVVEVREGKLPTRGEAVQILARNEAPRYICVECGEKQAQHICVYCLYDSGGMLCAKCAKKHECGEEALLPLVNSPRTGECGFTGARLT